MQGRSGAPSGEERPALGLGTWRLGEAPARAAAEVGSLRLALDIGYRVFDSAEMHGDGGAETVLGRALADALQHGIARDTLFVVSKVLPDNASADDVEAACERSLRRLGLDQLDLYLLHWRGAVPLADTVRGFGRLQRRGLIRLWGVSNFDLDDMRELVAVPGGAGCAANQVHYSLTQRGVEWDLLPWQRLQQMPLMAYSPIDQGALADHPALRPIAERHRVTPAQLALIATERTPDHACPHRRAAPGHDRGAAQPRRGEGDRQGGRGGRHARPGLGRLDDARRHRQLLRARCARAAHLRRRALRAGGRQHDARHAAPHRLGRRRRVGQGLRLLRPRLGQRARWFEDPLREGPAGLGPWLKQLEAYRAQQAQRAASQPGR